MGYRRLLVLSNNSFSTTDSNGRTLGGLLKGWPMDCIAQFCISTDGVDPEVCTNYFCVSDGDVVRSTLTFTPSRGRRLDRGECVNFNRRGGRKRFRKTAARMLARNAMWWAGLWRGRQFWRWIDSFKPEVVLLQSGDSWFMHHLALKIERETGARLAVFNTEAMALIDGDWLDVHDSGGVVERLLFPLYKGVYRRYFDRFMRHCRLCVYGNERLARDYAGIFDSNGGRTDLVIYATSDIVAQQGDAGNRKPVFSYLGNLGLDRPKALVEVGKTLQSLSPEYVLDVYGTPYTEAEERLLNSSRGVTLHRRVDYDEVKKIMAKSDFLFHVEHDSPGLTDTLRYGFSTKIADSLASGRVFVLYGPRDTAAADYITDNEAGIVASTPQELGERLMECISDPGLYDRIVDNALRFAAFNHDPGVNATRLQQAINVL